MYIILLYYIYSSWDFSLMICLNHFTFVKVEVIAEYFQHLPLSHETILEVKSVRCWLKHMHRQFWCLILYVSFIGSEDPQRICKILLYCFWCVFGECFWKRETFESVNWIKKTRHFQCEWVLLDPQKAMMGEGSVFFFFFFAWPGTCPFLTYQKPGISNILTQTWTFIFGLYLLQSSS